MIKRYTTIIMTVLEILNAREELKRLERLLANNIMVGEHKDYSFSEDDATAALKLLPESVVFTKATHVVSKLKYKNVEIHLHCEPYKSGRVAMEHILKAL